MVSNRFSLPPVVECAPYLEKNNKEDSYHSSDDDSSTAESTLIPSSSFSNDTFNGSPAAPPLRRHRGYTTPTAAVLELPTIVEKSLRQKRRLTGTPSSSWSTVLATRCRPASRTKLMKNIIWSLLIVVAVWCMCCDSVLTESDPLQVGTVPTEMERQLFQAKILHNPPGYTFTIILRGSRLSVLRTAVKRYQDCPGVHAIQLDWTGTDSPPPPLDFLDSPKTEQAGSKTRKSVLLLDESVSLSCDDIARGFIEWKRDPVRSVGFFPLVLENGSYALLSDRALFVHRSYYLLTHHHRHYPSRQHPCQEWVLSGRISVMSHKHALAMMMHKSTTVPPDIILDADGASSCHPLVAEKLSVSDLPGTRTIYVGG